MAPEEDERWVMAVVVHGLFVSDHDAAKKTRDTMTEGCDGPIASCSVEEARTGCRLMPLEYSSSSEPNLNASSRSVQLYFEGTNSGCASCSSRDTIEE